MRLPTDDSGSTIRATPLSSALRDSARIWIAAGTLDEHPAVEAVRVKVAKPHVRLDDTILAGSAVEILRHRETEPGN